MTEANRSAPREDTANVPEPTVDRKSHPVWAVYDSLRDARYYTQYFAAKLARVEKQNRFAEVVLAVAVPSSAVSALSIWSKNYGSVAWGFLTSVATVLAVVKPIFNFPEAIQSYSAAAGRWRTIDFQLMDLKTEIEQEQQYSPSMQTRYSEIRRSMAAAEESARVEATDERLATKIQQSVLGQLPSKNFFVPKS